MADREVNSEMPSAAGSPFKTKNFNKFFFGIMIAALVIGALFLFYFWLGVKHS